MDEDVETHKQLYINGVVSLVAWMKKQPKLKAIRVERVGDTETILVTFDKGDGSPLTHEY